MTEPELSKTTKIKVPKRLNAEVTAERLDTLLSLGDDLLYVIGQRVSTMADQDLIKALQLVSEESRQLNDHLLSIKQENPNLTVEDLGISVEVLDRAFDGVT